MPRKVHVCTLSGAVLLTRPHEKKLAAYLDLLDDAASLRPDIICLPEAFADETGDDPVKSDEIRDTLMTELGKRAKKAGSYIVAGAFEIAGGAKYNVAWLFGRDGALVGRYYKNHPTTGEINNRNVCSGTEIPVFDTDFGRIGVAICFDIGWPGVWQTLSDKGAELVVWPSAYDGGFPLQSYAWRHSYYVVSSVWTNHSKIIDKTGRVLHSSSRWQGWTYGVVDLEKELFHVGAGNHQDTIIRTILRKYGRDVTIESFSEEDMFTLESNSDAIPMSALKAEFSLPNHRDFHRINTELQLKSTAGAAP